MCEEIEQNKFCEHKIHFPWTTVVFRGHQFRESWNTHYSVQHTGYGSEINWLHNPELVETETSEALQQERQYEKCSYRRTACKELESLVSKYNKVWSYKLQTYDRTINIVTQSRNLPTEFFPLHISPHGVHLERCDLLYRVRID